MKTILFLPLILFTLLYAVFCEEYKVYEACIDGKGRDFILGDSGKKTAAILKGYNATSYQRCMINFRTTVPKIKILYAIRKLHLNIHGCSKSMITISAPSAPNNGIGLRNFFCSNINDCQESNSKLSDDSLLYFQIELFDFADFEIIITAYSDVFTPNFTHRCNNKKYISSSLICDGHNNCGDRSDEMNCTGISTPSFNHSCNNSSNCDHSCNNSSNCDHRCNNSSNWDHRCNNSSNCDNRCNNPSNCDNRCNNSSNCDNRCNNSSNCDNRCNNSSNCDNRCNNSSSCDNRCNNNSKCGHRNDERNCASLHPLRFTPRIISLIAIGCILLIKLQLWI